MEDTQSYLNSILQKRLGSVPNYGGYSKNGNTVTRLPKKQQKLQSMPTVFRNKTETIYRTTGVMPGEHNSKNPLLAVYNSKEPPQMKKQDPGHNQRVQYMAISKRIDSKKQQFTAPVVDVSKYRKTNYIPPDQIAHDPNEHMRNFASEQNFRPSTKFYRHQEQDFHRMKTDRSIQLAEEEISRQGVAKPTSSQVSRVSQFSQPSQGGARRKNIFALSKQKIKTIQQ